MKFNLKAVSDIIGAEVTSCERLLSGFGLSIHMRDVFNLSSVCTDQEDGFHNQNIYNLTKAFGVVVLHNANAGIDPQIRLTDRRAAHGGLLQDFFHHDSVLGDNSATILMKKPGDPRLAPTLYARLCDVRHALQQISTEDYSAEVQAALHAMTLNTYRFSQGGEDAWARKAILQACPSLTEQVAKMIPPEKIYAHYWGTYDRTVVLHSPGFNNDLLHGRQTSDQRRNTVGALKLFP